MVGRTISHYHILGKLGEGGMGVVYRAEDTTLKRTVALKFLPPELTQTPDAREHLIREAQTASSLEHPNICTIHEICEAEGYTFIVMAFIEGTTLQKTVESGPIEVGRAVEIALQVTDALAAAHDRGIVHRDIKAANIMVTPEGRAAIMDFGLAAPTEAPVRGRTTMGTAAYMSPEQAQGNPVDHRTDIWSLGVVLYQILTGRLPFGGDYEAAVFYSIMNEEAPDVRDLNPSVPEDLARVLGRALKKKPEHRYRSAAAMLEDLRAVHRRLQVGSPESRERPERRRGVRATTLVLLTLLLATFVVYRLWFSPSSREPITPVSVAVLDFENKTADPALSDVLAQLMMTDLAQSPYVKVLSTARMREIQRQMGIATLNDSTGLILSGRAGIQAVVCPTVLQMGETFCIQASVYDVATRDLLFAGRVQGTGQDAIFGMLDGLSREIRAKLKVILREDALHERRLSELTTSSMDAYKRYAQGRAAYDAGDPVTALAHLEHAAALDSTFLEALRDLAILYDVVGDPSAALSTACRAKEISRQRGAEEFFKSLVVEYRVRRDWDRAIATMRSYLELRPDDVLMHQRLGYVLSRHRKAFGEAIAEFERILVLDPTNLSGELGRTYNYLGHAYLFSGQFEQAMAAFDEYRSIAPDKPDPLHSTAEALRFAGRYGEAIETYSEVIRAYPGYFHSYEDLGLTYLATGKWREALACFRRYLSAAPAGLLPRGHLLLARVHCLQGDFDMARTEIAAALARNPSCCEAHWLLGQIALEEIRDLDRAREEGNMIAELLERSGETESAAYHHHLEGRILLAEGRLAEALDLSRQAIAASPREFMFFRRALAQAYLEAGRPVDAIEVGASLLELNPHDAHVLCLMGRAYAREKASEEAARCFERAQEIWRSADADFHPLEELETAWAQYR